MTKSSAASSAVALPVSYPAFMADLIDRAASVLKAQWQCVPVDFCDPCDQALRFVARLEWPLESPAPRLVVLSAFGMRICRSVPGRFSDIDTADWMGMAAPSRHAAALIAKAADAVKARWPGAVVEFPWWSEGDDRRFLARLEWSSDTDDDPHVIVLDGRSGDFVCRSMEGDLSTIDPSLWCLDVATDEIDKHEWETKQGSRS